MSVFHKIEGRIGKSPILFSLIILFAGFFIGVKHRENIYREQKVESQVNGNPAYLFIQKASSGMLVEEAKKTYLLTLKNIDPTILFLTDRPNRQVGNIKISDFINNIWNSTTDGFSKVQHNAALVYRIKDNEEEKVIILELLNAKYNTNDQTVTYTAKLYPNDFTQEINTFGYHGEVDSQPSFENPNLIIDSDFCDWCLD